MVTNFAIDRNGFGSLVAWFAPAPVKVSHAERIRARFRHANARRIAYNAHALREFNDVAEIERHSPLSSDDQPTILVALPGLLDMEI